MRDYPLDPGASPASLRRDLPAFVVREDDLRTVQDLNIESAMSYEAAGMCAHGAMATSANPSLSFSGAQSPTAPVGELSNFSARVAMVPLKSSAAAAMASGP